MYDWKTLHFIRWKEFCFFDWRLMRINSWLLNVQEFCVLFIFSQKKKQQKRRKTFIFFPTKKEMRPHWVPRPCSELNLNCLKQTKTQICTCYQIILISECLNGTINNLCEYVTNSRDSYDWMTDLLWMNGMEWNGLLSLNETLYVYIQKCQ